MMLADVFGVFPRCFFGVCSPGLENTGSSLSNLPVCLFRKMTFGKVNELGQFIRESEPEPDAKKSKGAAARSLTLTEKAAFTLLYLTYVSSEKDL